MLGLIFGTRAGETSLELFALVLPRFLVPLPPFLSVNIADGVLAAIGDPAIIGLPAAEPGLAEAGVLNGPSFGVFRAETCVALSSVGTNCVLI